MPTSSARNTATAVVSGLAMALLVILVHQKIMGYDEEGCSTPRWTTTDHSEDRLKLRQRAGRCKLEVDLRGDLRWTESEDAIAWIEPGGRLEVEEHLPDVRHRLKVRPSGADGTPEVEYWRDGEEMPVDATGRAWLHQVAMQLYRRTGVDAAARSRRIYDEGGVEALLDEVDEIDSDEVATRYAEAAFDAGDDDLATVLRAMSRRVGSDWAMARLLTKLAPTRTLWEPSPQFVRALSDALRSLGSDFELSRSLRAFLERTPSDGELAEELLHAASRGLGSDFEAARTLVAYAEGATAARPLAPATFDLLRTLGGDYEMRQALMALAHSGRTDDDVRRLLSVSHGMGSDYDMAEWLIALSKTEAGTDERRDALADAVRSAAATIGSDFERRRVEEAWGDNVVDD